MEDIIKVWKQYGIEGVIVAGLGLIVTGLLKSGKIGRFFSKISDRLLERVMERSSDENIMRSQINESNIVNHDIFNYIDFWMYSKVPAMKFSTDYRTAVFRKYLTVYLKCYKKELKRVVDSGEYKEMDSSELWKTMIDLLNQIVYQYESQSREQGIPDVVINKMKVKNNDTIQLTMDLIESVVNSQFYESENNYLKVYSIQNIILSVLESTISNSDFICNSINGELKGLTMDGFTEP